MDFVKKEFPRFAEIEHCLRGISFNMLKMLSEEDIMALGDTDKEKVLLKLLYNTCLIKDFTIDESFAKDNDKKPPFDKNSINLIFSDNMLISSKFSRYPMLNSGRISIDKLLESEESNQKLYYIVDFSNNILLDEDIPVIKKFIVEKNNVIQILSLAGNRISCSNNDYINDMWDIVDKVKLYVVVVANRMATLDGKAFFDGINDERANKIIWIPRNYLDGNSWHNVIPDNDKAFYDLVLKTHKEYYQMMNYY